MNAFKTLTIVGLAAGIAACDGGPAERQGPQPGEDLLIVFMQKENPGNCEVYQKLYAAPETGLGRVNLDFIYNTDQMTGTGEGMIDRDGDGLLDGGGDFFSKTFDGMACSEVTLRIRPTTCEDTDGNKMDCPNIRFEGLEMFASAEQTEF